MVDHLTKEKRSWNMSRVKGKNTKPELVVRSFLHNNGYRFRLHRKDLPGKPDIVLPKYNTVVFIHGCFWHQHKNCKRATIPKTNKKYWIPKLQKNIENDKRYTKELKSLGWKIIILWECQINRNRFEKKLIAGIK